MALLPAASTKQMMMDEGEEFATGPANNVKGPGGSNRPSSSNKKQSTAMLLMEQEGEGGAHVDGSTMSKKDELMNMAGDGIPRNKLESPSDDLTCLGGDYATGKPGCNALVGGSVSSSVSVDGPTVTAMSTLGTVTSTLQKSSQKINDDIKHELMKEVYKFGQKYERLFILLEEVQGPLEVKKQFIEFTIKEAARFKRQDLVQHLKKLLEKNRSQ